MKRNGLWMYARRDEMLTERLLRSLERARVSPPKKKTPLWEIWMRRLMMTAGFAMVIIGLGRLYG